MAGRVAGLLVGGMAGVVSVGSGGTAVGAITVGTEVGELPRGKGTDAGEGVVQAASRKNSHSHTFGHRIMPDSPTNIFLLLPNLPASFQNQEQICSKKRFGKGKRIRSQLVK